MKSEVTIKPEESQQQFPALYKTITCGAVMLFTDETTATVVVGSTVHTLGDHDDGGWLNCHSAECWQRLPSGSQVILTQE